MPFSSIILRYFYIWLVAAVLITEALTGFRGSIRITFFSEEPLVSMRLWHVALAMAGFLILTGLTHIRIDGRGMALPRWIKRSHPVVSALFCAVVFIYLQILESRRLNNPLKYFQADQLRYWEEANLAVVVLAVVFLAAQVLFGWFLISALGKRQSIPNKS